MGSRLWLDLKRSARLGSERGRYSRASNVYSNFNHVVPFSSSHLHDLGYKKVVSAGFFGSPLHRENMENVVFFNPCQGKHR